MDWQKEIYRCFCGLLLRKNFNQGASGPQGLLFLQSPPDRHKEPPRPGIISPNYRKQVILTAAEKTYFIALFLGVLAYSCWI
jgi:hypothetical protein